MEQELTKIETKSTAGRVFAIAVIIGALVFAWFAIRWQIGSMFAVYTPVNAPNARDVAEFAVSLSPSDPVTSWYLASVRKDSFRPEDQNAAIEELENAVRKAPSDFRYWIELGRAHEQNDRFENAEKALLRAVELAPNYSEANWHLGNFYLRRGDESKSFAALRKSAEESAVFSEQVYGVLWNYYEKDRTKLETLAGDRADLRAGLAKFYAMKELPADSLRIWNLVPESEKTRYAGIARLIGQALYDKRYYRSAQEFIRQLGVEPAATAETFQNGSFETPIAADPRETYFGWQVLKKEKLDAGPDSMKKKDGNRSLRLTFNGLAATEIKTISQIVTVLPNTKYRLTFWFKTEALKSAGTPTVEIVNATDTRLITTTPPVPSGTQDWTQSTIDFTSPADAEAVAVRIDRSFCGDACPIVGTLWLDDFRLEKF